MGFVAWIFAGLIAGWLAGLVMKGGGYGLLADLVLGMLGIWHGGGMIASIAVAFVGAVILVWFTRLFKKG